MQPSEHSGQTTDQGLNTALVKFWTTPEYAEKLRRIANHRRDEARRRVGKSEVVRQEIEPIIDKLYAELPPSAKRRQAA